MKKIRGRIFNAVGPDLPRNEQKNLLGMGLKFIKTPVQMKLKLKKTKNKNKLLRDFDQFARRMRLQYIYHGEDTELHPSHVINQHGIHQHNHQ